MNNPTSATPIKHRHSITTLLTLTSLLILLLFISVAALMQNRLLNFQHMIADIAETAVPSVVRSSEVYSEINQLLYLAESLSQAPSQAIRHNIYQEILQNLQDLEVLTQASQSELYQRAQLVALTEELASLNLLISRRLDIHQKLQQRIQQIYLLYEKVQANTQQQLLLSPSQNLVYSDWLLNFSELVALSGQGLTMERLRSLRQLQGQIQQQLAEQQQLLQQFTGAAQAQAQLAQQQLEQWLLADEGLWPLQLERLHIHGRAIGRSNFVRNLLLDYARLAANSSYEVTSLVLADAAKSKQQTQHYSQQILMVSGLVILLLAAGIYIVHLRVVKRLEILNQNVRRQMQGKLPIHQVDGFDEIAAISESFSFFASRVEQQQHELTQLSLTDSLTGIANRRALTLRIHELLAQAQRQQWPLSVLMIDIDCFKAYNDHYGHQAGDQALQQVARLLSEGVNRATDVVARYGGEEFVVVLPETGQGAATSIATELQQKVVQAAIEHTHNVAMPVVTVSIGVACLERATPADYDQLLHLADEALYRAKAAGRNQVC